MKTLRNLKIEYPTEEEINRSIEIIYDQLPKPKRRLNPLFKVTLAFGGYLAVFLVIGSIILSSGFTKNKSKQSTPKYDNITLMEGVNISYSENVFIGEIIAKEKDLDGSDTYTYQVKSIYDLKGKTKESEYITQYNSKYNSNVTADKDAKDQDLPGVNKIYIFVANRDSSGKFVIDEKYDVKQLEGFIPGKPLEEQPEQVRKQIDQFLLAIRYPITYKLSNFLARNKITDITFRPEFDFQQIPRLDIRLYYIDNNYYLYYNNRTSVNYAFKYVDYNGINISLDIPSQKEYIGVIYLANEEVEFYLDHLYIGSLMPKEQDIDTYYYE